MRIVRETIDNRDPQRFMNAATNVSRRIRSRLGGTDAKAASAPPSDATDPRLGSTYDFSYDGVMRSHEESLARLGARPRRHAPPARSRTTTSARRSTAASGRSTGCAPKGPWVRSASG